MAATEFIKKTYRPSSTVGQVYARIYGSTDAMAPIGNVLELNLEHTEDVQTQPDMTALGGGTHAELRRVTEVGISMKLADLNVTNLARGTYGTVHGVDAGDVQNEEHTARLGGLIRLAHAGPTNVIVSTTSQSVQNAEDEEHKNVNQGDSVTTSNPNPSNVSVKVGSAGSSPIDQVGNYTVTPTGILIDSDAPDIEDSDDIYITYDYPEPQPVAEAGNFEVRPEGIFIFDDAQTIGDNDTLYISYDFGDQAIIEALTTGAVKLQLAFGGLNEAESGKPCVVDVWHLSQSITQQLALINEGFGALPVSGSVLMDPSRTGTGISRYYRQTLVA